MSQSLSLRAGIVSVLILLAFIGAWWGATLPTQVDLGDMDPEYAKMMGLDTVQESDLPTPGDIAAAIGSHLSNPFEIDGSSSGIGIQLAHSLWRVLAGFVLAALVAVPLGFLIGMSPLMHKALDPYIQILKPISPLAWMPLALYIIQDASISSIFVIFICSIWPMMVNTAYGVASVRDDWLAVAKTLEVGPIKKAFKVILPAALPTILTGMRISMGIAWLVIVAAEMLVGGTGIGYFIWNEWNNLDLANVIFAILLIGVVGMILDMIFGLLGKAVRYKEV
ncbi:nitrate ABC transporter permease [Guyparkeria sp.]|uniref:nitrate ABC transporter permease n=1 Tax=Guyparkeria sp. TaxID=2035736 RepID=UPI003970F0FA